MSNSVSSIWTPLLLYNLAYSFSVASSLSLTVNVAFTLSSLRTSFISIFSAIGLTFSYKYFIFLLTSNTESFESFTDVNFNILSPFSPFSKTTLYTLSSFVTVYGIPFIVASLTS